MLNLQLTITTSLSPAVQQQQQAHVFSKQALMMLPARRQISKTRKGNQTSHETQMSFKRVRGSQMDTFKPHRRTQHSRKMLTQVYWKQFWFWKKKIISWKGVWECISKINTVCRCIRTWVHGAVHSSVHLCRSVWRILYQAVTMTSIHVVLVKSPQRPDHTVHIHPFTHILAV